MRIGYSVYRMFVLGRNFVFGQLYVQIGDLKLSNELKEKLIGLDREGSRLGLGIWLASSVC